MNSLCMFIRTCIDSAVTDRVPVVSSPPQWSGSVPGPLREAASLKPAQVQLLPLRAGSVRQTRSARGDRADLVCGLCGA